MGDSLSESDQGRRSTSHVVGARWLSIELRLEMLEEAVEVMRELWDGGFVTHHGKHYTVENARIYTKLEKPPSVSSRASVRRPLSSPGVSATAMSAPAQTRILLRTFRDSGGAGKPTQAGYKVCWGTDDDVAVATAHRLWANSGLPGELAQVLPSPRHFEQASELVTEDMTRESIAYGADVQRKVACATRRR
jgi:G6PDH family F420-dependent oxidoreductase